MLEKNQSLKGFTKNQLVLSNEKELIKKVHMYVLYHLLKYYLSKTYLVILSILSIVVHQDVLSDEEEVVNNTIYMYNMLSFERHWRERMYIQCRSTNMVHFCLSFFFFFCCKLHM